MPADPSLPGILISSIWWELDDAVPTIGRMLDILEALADRLAEIYQAAGLDAEWIIEDGRRSGCGSGVHVSSDAPSSADYRWVVLPQSKQLLSRVIAAVLDCLSCARCVFGGAL